MELFFNQYFNEEYLEYSVIIEETEKVCYAYLLKSDDILADVWLYNLIPNKSNSWRDISEEDLPLQNISKYIINEGLDKIDNEDEVFVEWENKGDLIKASIFIENKLLAVIKSDEDIGYSTNVNKDLPIAKKY